MLRRSCLRKEYPADYAIQTVVTLKQILKSRQIPLQKMTKKQEFIDCLRKWDKDHPFPFLNLHPELRNIVYRELLVTDYPASFTPIKCHPEILATCQIINHEATGILYGLNKVHLTFDMDCLPKPWMPGGIFWRVIQMAFRDGFNYQLSYRHTSQIQADIDHYPSFLKKMQDFTIDIRCPALTTIRVNALYEADPDEFAYSSLISIVRCFASFIMDKNKIQTLLIRLDLGADLNVQDVASILSPLLRLYGIPEVTIVLKNGEAPLPILRLLKDVIQDPTPVHNVLKQFTLLAHELICTEPIRFISCLQQLYWAFHFQDRARHFLMIKKKQETEYDEEAFHDTKARAEAILDSLTYVPSGNSVPNQQGNDTFLEKSFSLANGRMILQAKIDSKIDRESFLSSIGLGTESTDKLQ
jgi:hypothetical protein